MRRQIRSRCAPGPRPDALDPEVPGAPDPFPDAPNSEAPGAPGPRPDAPPIEF